MNNLKLNLDNIRARIAGACSEAGRDASEIRILAVSKKHSVERIEALHDLGQLSFGENYVQEALTKIAYFAGRNIEWHFIGPLQSNKTGEVAQHFQWVQSVDRIKIMQRLSRQRPANLPALNICIQVNIDLEPQKAGVMPDRVKEFVDTALSLPGLRLRGLMAIPKAASGQHDPSESFVRMNNLFRGLVAAGVVMDTLSMGMSADLEAAIMHGSTMVRIGTDLLGPRPDSSTN